MIPSGLSLIVKLAEGHRWEKNKKYDSSNVMCERTIGMVLTN